MEINLLLNFLDFIINLDSHLTELINQYGTWTYLILFVVIFCETGLVVTPFLPGDSLIFVLGALGAAGDIDIVFITLVLMSAAILGNQVNYHIGRYIGPRAFEQDKVRFLKREYLIRTHEFYARHGGKTIVLARFIPIIRTFAPFVAGIGMMNYRRFLIYNVSGCIAWVMLLIIGGYSFGNIPLVKDNFTLVIFGIIFISLLPAIVGFLGQKIKKN